MIPRETIDRIFDAAKIEDVVGSYVSLKKRGANLLGLCPFHHEKTGSFTVSPSKGIYKCFGCGKAGNAVRFGNRRKKGSEGNHFTCASDDGRACGSTFASGLVFHDRCCTWCFKLEVFGLLTAVNP